MPVSFLIPLTITASAFAQDKNCPPGSWFCESVTIGGANANIRIGGGGDDDPATAKPDGDDDVAKSPDDSPKAKAKPAVEVDTAEGDDAVVVVKKRRRNRVMVVREDPGAPVGRARVRERRWRENFGLNLRVEGAALVPRNGADVVGMGGAGASFRWRPSPFFAFDLGGDIVGGKDYEGNDRVEFAGSLSGMLFFNPQHRVQVYAIGGMHLSHAEVESYCTLEVPTYRYDTSSYVYGGCGDSSRNYFGGHGGLGLDFRISRHFSMFIDALALIRTRIDSEVEFYDQNTGESTNTSGAGLFRTGVSFWW